MNAQRTMVQAGGYGGGHGGGGTSVWKKVLLITGLGCAVLVLVGGLLMGLGVFRVATCCIEHGEKQEYLRSASYEFAEALHREDYDRAFGMLDEREREQISLHDFRAEFEELGLDERPPLPVEMARHIDREERNEWRVDVDFAAPRSSEVIRLSLTIDDDHVDVDADASHLGIRDWEVTRTTRVISQVSYAEAAMRFQRLIRQRDYDAARFMVPHGHEWRGQSSEEFAEAVQPLADALATVTHEEVYGLYPEDNHRLRVQLLVTDVDGDHYFIDYYVGRFMHGIDSVSELRPAHDVEPLEEEQPGQPEEQRELVPLDMPDDVKPIGDVDPEEQ